MWENVQYLQRLGLTEYQARALTVLFFVEDTTAKEISSCAEIPPTKIYSVLESLEDKELVIHHPGKPRLYRSLNAQSVMEVLLMKKQRLIDILRDDKPRQLDILHQLQDEKERYLYPAEQVHPTLPE